MLFLQSLSVSATPPSDESMQLHRSTSWGGAEDTPAATRGFPAATPGAGVGGIVYGGVSSSGAVKRVRSTGGDAVLRLEGLLDCYVRTGGVVPMDVEGHAPSLQG
jgi:hypothetical protein